MKKRFIRLGGAIFVVVAVVLGTGVVVASAADKSDCDSSYFCVYTDRNQNGDMGEFHRGAADLGTFKGDSGRHNPGYLQDNIESVYNRSSSSVTIYENADYCGEFVTIAAGRSMNLSTVDNGKLVNRVSSIKVGSGSSGNNSSGNNDCANGRTNYNNNSNNNNDNNNSNSRNSDSDAYNRSGSCNSNSLCVYIDRNRGGTKETFDRNHSDIPDLGDFSNGSNDSNYLQDDISSVYNRTGDYVNLYSEANYCGDYSAIAPGDSVNLNRLQDRVSSIRFNGSSDSGTAPCDDNNSNDNNSSGNSSGY